MKTFIILVFVILLLTEWLKKALGKTKATPDIIVQALSWIVGAFTFLTCQVFGLKDLQNVSLFTSMLYGLFAALCTNGIADTKIIQTFLLLFKKKK